METGSKSKSELSRTRSKFKRLSQLHFDFISSSARNWKCRGNLRSYAIQHTTTIEKTDARASQDSSSKRSPSAKPCLLMSGDPYEKAGNSGGRHPLSRSSCRAYRPIQHLCVTGHRIRSASELRPPDRHQFPDRGRAKTITVLYGRRLSRILWRGRGRGCWRNWRTFCGFSFCRLVESQDRDTPCWGLISTDISSIGSLLRFSSMCVEAVTQTPQFPFGLSVARRTATRAFMSPNYSSSAAVL
jgi:hypothetical protein